MRLTQKVRDTIQTKLLDSVIRARIGEFEKEEHGLALRLTIARYGADVFDRCRVLPEGWLHAHKVINLDYNIREYLIQPTCATALYYNGRQLNRQWVLLELAEYAILPNSFAKPWSSEDIEQKQLQELIEFSRARAGWLEELEHLNRQLKATLTAFTTVERLAQDWPEGYAFFPHESLAQVAGLPAPRIADLNERIAVMRKDAA